MYKRVRRFEYGNIKTQHGFVYTLKISVYTNEVSSINQNQ